MNIKTLISFTIQLFLLINIINGELYREESAKRIVKRRAVPGITRTSALGPIIPVPIIPLIQSMYFK